MIVPTDSSPALRMRTGEGLHTYLTMTSPPGVSRPASHVSHIVRANGCCSGVVASCAIAVPPRLYVSCTAPVQSRLPLSGGLSMPSSSARSSGVRFMCA